MKETLAARLARQMAEVHPGIVCRFGGSTAPARGEREKVEGMGG